MKLSYDLDPSDYRTPMGENRRESFLIPTKPSPMTKQQKNNALSDFYKGKKQMSTSKAAPSQTSHASSHALTSTIQKPKNTIYPAFDVESTSTLDH